MGGFSYMANTNPKAVLGEIKLSQPEPVNTGHFQDEGVRHGEQVQKQCHWGLILHAEQE